MNQHITPQQCAEIVKQLLAPTELERLAADQVLFALSLDDESHHILQASIRLIEDRDVFIPALISYWARAALKSYNARMSAWPDRLGSLQSTWLSPHEDHFPYEHHSASQHTFWLGLNRVITYGLGTEATVALPQLMACLSHPEPVCESAVSEVLLTMGPAAREALPTLLAYIREKGAYRRPNIEAKAVVALIDHNEDEAVVIARELPINPDLAAGYCPIFDELEKPVPRVVDILLDMFNDMKILQQPPIVLDLLPCVARLARKADHRVEAVRQRVLSLANDSSDDRREAAAWALGSVCDPQQDMPLLIALSQDPEWVVRWAAHDSASYVEQPSAELVQATAADLGNYDGYDGAPHDEALSTLIHWGDKSAPAIEKIAAWIISEIDDPCWDASDVRQAIELLTALGDTALPLLPDMQRLYAIWHEDETDEDEVGDQDDIEDVSDTGMGLSFDVGWLDAAFNEQLNEMNQELAEMNTAHNQIRSASEALIARLGIEDESSDNWTPEPEPSELLLTLINRLNTSQLNT